MDGAGLSGLTERETPTVRESVRATHSGINSCIVTFNTKRTLTSSRGGLSILQNSSATAERQSHMIRASLDLLSELDD